MQRRDPADSHVGRLLTEAEISAERIVGYGRCAIGFAASWMFFTVVVPRLAPDNPIARQVPFIAAFSLGYLAVGIASLILARPGRFRPWTMWLFTTLDVCFWWGLSLSAVINVSVPANYIVAAPPTILCFLMLALASLRNSPALLGYTLALLVAGLVGLYLLAPGAPAPSAPAPNVHAAARDAAPADVLFQTVQNVARLSMLVLTGVILILLTFRTRRLLDRAIAETVQRTNLARYLPPQLAGRLAAADGERLRQGAVQQAAVLFIDIRGFTARAERMNPHALSEFLGEFRAIVSAVVHRHNGIVDKFVGDSVMAVFGAVHRGPGNASDALDCVTGIVAAVDDWNETRRNGQGPVTVGIGAHWGEVFCGTIGVGERLEFTVLGDTVNVAARLEGTTKETGRSAVVSGALLAAAGVADPAAAGWHALAELPIRGRTGRLAAFALGPV